MKNVKRIPRKLLTDECSDCLSDNIEQIIVEVYTRKKRVIYHCEDCGHTFTLKNYNDDSPY